MPLALQPGVNSYLLQLTKADGSTIANYIHLVRGDPVTADLLVVEQFSVDDEIGAGAATVTLSVVETGLNTFTVHADGDASNDYRIELPPIFGMFISSITPPDSTIEVKSDGPYHLIQNVGPHPTLTSEQYNFTMFKWDGFRSDSTQ